MAGDVISPELALVDPVAALAHRSTLPAVVVDSAISAARVDRGHVARSAATPPRVEVSFTLPVWLAVTTYVVVKVAVAVVVAMALVGSVALAGSLLLP